MARLKGCVSIVFLVAATLLEVVAARLINTTIYDTNLGHVTYEPKAELCARWTNMILWKACERWVQPWKSDSYLSQGQLATMHRSLNHWRPSVTVEFEGARTVGAAVEHLTYPANQYTVYVGSAIWLYGPPRAQLTTIPPDHKVCLYENHRLASNEVCYRVNVANAYSEAERYDEPVVIFAKGGLQHQQHRVIISIGDPTDNTQSYLGIQFSHAVYTIERPTPWPVEEDRWRYRQVVMHDTHPLLSYTPNAKVPVSECFLWWCWYTGDAFGWTPKTYRDENGTLVSWHELRSQAVWTMSAWGVDATITAGSVAVYGIPKAHITGYYSLLSQLPGPLTGHLENIDIPHDSRDIVYHPGRRCVRHFAWWCTKWFDPWVWREEGPSGSRLTYRSTVSAYRTTEDPAISFSFQGSAVYVYGAPRSFIKTPFAMQHVCINDVCHVVDVEQAYMNAPIGTELQSAEQHIFSNQTLTVEEHDTKVIANATLMSVHPEYEPVLIWSMIGLDDQVTHTLRLALAALPSDDNAEMTIAKVVYTKVSYGPGQSRPDTPIPEPDPRYEGPLYPPYAQKWTPRIPPPLPTPNLPPRPSPHPPSQSPQPSHSIQGSLVAVIIIVPFFLFSLLICCLAVTSQSADRGETEPLIPPRPPPFPRPLPPLPRPTPRPASPPRPSPPNPPPILDLIQWLDSASDLPTSPTQPIATSQCEQNNIGPCPGPNLASALPDPDVSSQPPSYTQPPSYSGYRHSMFDDTRTAISTTSTILPSYTQVQNENRIRQERALEYVIQQRVLRSEHQPAMPQSRNEIFQDTGPTGVAVRTRQATSLTSICLPAQSTVVSPRQQQIAQAGSMGISGAGPRDGQPHTGIPWRYSQQRIFSHTPTQRATNPSRELSRATNREHMPQPLGSTTSFGYTRGGSGRQNSLNRGAPGIPGGTDNHVNSSRANAPLNNERGGHRGGGGQGGSQGNGSGRSNNNQSVQHEQRNSGDGSRVRGGHEGRGRRGRA